MNVHDSTVTKIRQLPEPLAQEVSDFIDFLLLKQDRTCWQYWNQFAEGLGLAEAGFSEYLSNLKDYEDLLQRGEIEW